MQSDMQPQRYEAPVQYRNNEQSALKSQWIAERPKREEPTPSSDPL